MPPTTASQFSNKLIIVILYAAKELPLGSDQGVLKGQIKAPFLEVDSDLEV